MTQQLEWVGGVSFMSALQSVLQAEWFSLLLVYNLGYGSKNILLSLTLRKFYKVSTYIEPVDRLPKKDRYAKWSRLLDHTLVRPQINRR